MNADDAETFTSGSVTLTGAELRSMAGAWGMIGITRGLTKSR